MSNRAEAVSTAGGVMPVAGTTSRALTLWRRLGQLAGLAILGQWSFYGIFRCPFIVPFVSCQNCPVITCHGRLFTMFWGFWLLLPLAALLFGRAFCGWVCPGGLVNELLGKLAGYNLRSRNLFTRLAPWGAYLGLAVSLFVWLVSNQPRSNIPIRVGEFFPAVALTFEHAGTIWLVRSFLVLGFFAVGLLLANAWCRFACPTGGLLELVKRWSIFKVYQTDKCIDCDKCLQVCEMGTRPEAANCTNCGDCLDACPQGAIRIGRKKSA
jgi:polyferredoxin